METLVIVIAAEGWGFQAVANALEPSHQVSLVDDRYLEVSQATSSAYVCVMDPQEDGLFEDWPEVLIPKGPFAAFSVDYRDPILMESIVREISVKVATAIDTNFGDVVSGGEFIARIDRDNPRWEWWHWPHDLDDSFT
ncbi:MULTISPECIES: hypothetical protein [Streptomyces]|uniref:hypothetical protein n=1 Tax=Streptomyces TaxID=1883 RepID=UPI0012FE9501|nr:MULTISPECIES: hypothetical protein [Streptomyces]